ncbi:hypothetical protein KXD40_003421 [Peronospora effusa]|uniref:C2H2-type domain-containing protein n=1 Tax=Peronospora effusa TaxID=542832 RepID=A0A3M6VES5_9STRA|nr:hypothetical protein DD238_005754 [Peronospora effusa]RQM15846.1 hypothetical protein DD237_005872 [Peronospora effusa]UIZ23174.1 hypothetical protein KXD40_003421 [Peronospora effusa]CAI5724713.1 unnamed protein product [Peronospora effusa]
MTDKKKEQQESLAQLVRDLETKETLCHVKEYPEVELKKLNDYVKKHGPLVNPVFGEQPAFFIDEGRFVPYRMFLYGNSIVTTKIGCILGNWATWSGDGGRVTMQGEFISGTDVRLPAIAYTPRDTHKGPLNGSTWTYHGEPYAPTFVVEIDKLSGQGSQRSTLDRKMRNEYFQHGVRLGWLIDPRPGHQHMYEYYLDETGGVQCSDNTAWRDLSGGNVLPGFTLMSTVLEMVLNQDPGSSEEEEVDLECPYPTCRQRFRYPGAFTAHVEWHRAERARQKYLAKRM